MANTTNYNWETPDDTDLVKDGAAAIRTLGSAIDTTVFNNAAAAIAKSIVDAKGDIIAATAADTVSRLAVGANDTVLTADSSTATGLKWAAIATGATFAGCALYDSNATQSIANGTNTALTWDTESFDVGGYHSTASNTSRITIPSGKDGKYLFTGATFYAGNATGVRVLKFFKNGTELFESNFNRGDGTNFTTLNISAIIDLVATDYIELVTLQNSGGNLNAYKNSAPFYGWFAATYLGA